MSATVSALVIAVVGVLGTLMAPIISHRLSSETKRQEFELERIHRQDEHSREQQRSALAERKACYVTITASSRRYRVQLMDYLHAVNRGTVTESIKAELEEAHRAYIADLAETYLIASLTVLDALRPVNTGFSEAYRNIKELEDGAQERRSFESTRDFLLRQWDTLRDLRTAMREDLSTLG